MDLNDDVVTEILVNLPVKSLLRFKSVCKTWCSIIGSSAFRKFHLQNQPRNNNDDDDILYLQISGNKKGTWELSSTLSLNNWKLGKDFPATFQDFLNANFLYDLIVDGPINGLICMYNEIPLKDESLGCSISVAICNPCLGEIKILPVSPLCSSVPGCVTRIIGFGFDSVSEDYKVVQIMRSLDGRAYVEVYSGRTNTWRVLVTNIFDDDYRSYFRVGMWIQTVYKGSGAAALWRIRSGEEDVIMSFDMHNEMFEIIRLPEFKKPGDGEVFAKDDDSLVLFAYSADYSQLEVWELEIAAKERDWTRVGNVNISKFEGSWALRVITLWKYGVVLGSYHDKKELIFYDYRTENERKCVELPIRLGCGDMYLEYKSTLNSLEICLN